MTSKTDAIPRRPAPPPDEMTKAIAGLSVGQQNEILRRLTLMAQGKPKDWGPDDLAKLR